MRHGAWHRDIPPFKHVGASCAVRNRWPFPGHFDLPPRHGKLPANLAGSLPWRQGGMGVSVQIGAGIAACSTLSGVGRASSMAGMEGAMKCMPTTACAAGRNDGTSGKEL